MTQPALSNWQALYGSTVNFHRKSDAIDMAGRQQQILDERDRCLEAARQVRAQRRAALRAANRPPLSSPLEALCV